MRRDHLASLTASVLLALALHACGRDEPPAVPASARVFAGEEEARQAAADAAAALMKSLFEKLSAALAEGAPAHALRVCGDAADEIAQRVRAESGIRVGRTSLRVRNPQNRPDAWERAWLDQVALRDKPPTEPESEVVTAADGSRELRFVRPIFVAELCTKCHGPRDALDTDVRRALAERYPDDEAVDYAPGDFRGIVSVRVPLAAG